MPLTTEWSVDGYRELAAAAVVDGFKTALRAMKVLYSLDHEDESINTRAMVRSINRRSKWKSSSGDLSIESYRLKCERELNEVTRFVQSDFFTAYTDVEPDWFLKELDEKLMEWVYAEERKIERENKRRKEGRR